MQKVFLLLLALLYQLVSPGNSLAVDVIPPGGDSIDLPPSPARGFSGPQFVAQLITKVLPLVLSIGGFIAVIVIIISGIQFVLSSGNPEAAGAAKNRLVYAIVGFIIIILAFAILQIVDRLFLGNTGIV